MVDVLHNEQDFQKAVQKWNDYGILYADDIIREASSPIDYHMRVAENDVQSGYG